ncbi:MAG: hypothetical protein ACYS0I_19960 [Planctomycetota bacterium]
MSDRILIFEYSTFRYAVAIGLKHHRVWLKRNPVFTKDRRTSMEPGHYHLHLSDCLFPLDTQFSLGQSLIPVPDKSFSLALFFKVQIIRRELADIMNTRLVLAGLGSSHRKYVKRDLCDNPCLV